ncbi:hypothetical protein Tco_0620296, partial [Tanacetum coccineum]
LNKLEDKLALEELMGFLECLFISWEAFPVLYPSHLFTARGERIEASISRSVGNESIRGATLFHGKGKYWLILVGFSLSVGDFPEDPQGAAKQAFIKMIRDEVTRPTGEEMNRAIRAIFPFDGGNGCTRRAYDTDKSKTRATSFSVTGLVPAGVGQEYQLADTTIWHRVYRIASQPTKRIEREQAANLAVQKEHEEQAAQSFTLYWNFPMIDDDDDEHTIQYRLYLERSSKAITHDLSTEEPDNSLRPQDFPSDNATDADITKCNYIAQKDEAGIQLNSEKFNFMAAVGAYDEIEKVTANCNLQDNLQQASTSGTQSDKAPVYDSDGSAEVHHSENCYDNDIFNMFTQEEEYIELLEPILEPRQIQQNDSNVIFAVSSVEQSGRIVEQHHANVEETRVLYDSLYNHLAIEVEKVNLVNYKLRETNADLTNELARYKNQESCFEINQEKYDKLERQPNAFQSECPKFSKTRVPQKVDEMNDLSNTITSNSVPTPQESKVVKNDNVIEPRMFKINPFKASRVKNFVPDKHVKASIRTKPITISQPHVITKNDVNSKTNGFSPTYVKSTTRTKRPQPRNNTKNDKNAKSKGFCAMCKKCLITANHDVCVLNYVNDMNSRALNKKAHVSNIENQKKHMPKVWKPKKVGSKERLALPKTSTHRSCLRWSPTGRLFDLKRKIIATSESVCQSDCSKGGQNWFDTLLIPLLSEYKPKDKEDHGDNECDI